MGVHGPVRNHLHRVPSEQNADGTALWRPEPWGNGVAGAAPDWKTAKAGSWLARGMQGRIVSDSECGGANMVALVALVLILAVFGGLGFAVHVLWYVLIAAVLLWLIGFFIGGIAETGGRRWYGRW
jgi:hypothetical protein